MSAYSRSQLERQQYELLAQIAGEEPTVEKLSSVDLARERVRLLGVIAQNGTGGGGPAVDQAARDAAEQAQQEVDALEGVVAALPDGTTDQQARDDIAALKTRQSIAHTTASLAAGASATFEIAVPKTFTLLTLSVSAQARVRAYGTSSARTADEARAFGADPSDAVYPDLSFDSNLPHRGSLTAKVYEDFSPNEQGTWYMRLTNTGSSAAAITLTLEYLILEEAAVL